MPMTTLWPWPNRSLHVNIKSTEALMEQEKIIVTAAIRIAFSNHPKANKYFPSIKEIKSAIEDVYPDLAKKLISRKYYYLKERTFLFKL